jgi:hypothetical protein
MKNKNQNIICSKPVSFAIAPALFGRRLGLMAVAALPLLAGLQQTAAQAVDQPDRARPRTIYIGNSLDVPNGGPDGIPPLVIMGEYDLAGPLAESPMAFPAKGKVTEVKFYGADYDFTLYALERVKGRTDASQLKFRVVAAERFAGSDEPGVHSFAVSHFSVKDGDLLAFAGIGPWYPQNPDDSLFSDATYENSAAPASFAATPPRGPGTEFTVGPYTDPGATYEYISDYFGNQGRIYGIGVEFEADHRW